MRLPQRSSIPCASAKHGSGKAPGSGALRRYSPSKFGDRGRGPWSDIAVTRYHIQDQGRCRQARVNVCRQQGNGVCVLLLIPYLLPAAPTGNGTPALLVSRSEISDATAVNPIQPQTAPRHLSTAEHSPPHLSTACPINPSTLNLAACALPSCPSCLMVLALACALCTHPDPAPDPGPDAAQALSFTKYCNACLLPLLFFVDEPVMVGVQLEL
jgi:hypothetical protein